MTGSTRIQCNCRTACNTQRCGCVKASRNCTIHFHPRGTGDGVCPNKPSGGDEDKDEGATGTDQVGDRECDDKRQHKARVQTTRPRGHTPFLPHALAIILLHTNYWHAITIIICSSLTSAGASGRTCCTKQPTSNLKRPLHCSFLSPTKGFRHYLMLILKDAMSQKILYTSMPYVRLEQHGIQQPRCADINTPESSN